MPTLPGSSYRFGPFEANSSSGQLLKDGVRVRLQEQPFLLLIVLLEKRGEMVSRAELQSRIWPANIFVDFDSSLRVAVGKLRDALGDDANDPRYIETVPKRGYRFLGDREVISSPIEMAEPGGMPRYPVAIHELKAGRGKWLLYLAIPLVLASTAAVFFYLARKPKAPVLRNSVVIADFKNTTGEPVFDDTLRQGIAVQLEQSPFLTVVSEDRIQRELKLMGQPRAPLSSDIAREVCERTMSGAVLDGSISGLGSQYVLGLRAVDCRSGRLLAQEQVQVARKEDVLNELSRMTGNFRSHLGEASATLQQYDTPIADATTGSIEALKFYTAGLRALASSGEAAALPLFDRASETDPQFAMAYAQLGLMYGTLGESDRSAENTSKAYELRTRTSDRERFFIEASYEGRVTGNLEKAQSICEAWARLYPDELFPHAYLAGFIYPASGKYEKAVEEAGKLIQINPDFPIGYSLLAFNDRNLGRLDEVQTALRRAEERNLDIPDLSEERFDLAFLEHNPSAMRSEATRAQQDTEGEDLIIYYQASAAAYVGHLREARSLSHHAEELAKQSSHKERAALFETGNSLWEAFFGNAFAARNDALVAMESSKDREVLYGAALALSLAGDYDRSREITDNLDKRFPEDTSVRFNYLPTLQATRAWAHLHPQTAIEALKIAIPYEFGTPRSTIHGNFGAMYPAFVRGETRLAAHQPQDAVVEFQKILDHRGIVASDPIGALAYLQLGRSYSMLGDKAKAKVAYQEFLRLWSTADPEIPILVQAKKEYAHLL